MSDKYYRVVKSNKAEELVEAVNKLMDDGYTPIGGISQIKESSYLDGIGFMQAVYRSKPTEYTGAK